MPYYMRLDSALQDVRAYRLNKTLDHNEQQVCDLFDTLNQYLDEDPDTLKLDPCFVRTVLFATTLFLKMQGTVDQMLEVQERVCHWRLPLDTAHHEAARFGPDIDFPTQRIHLPAPIGEYAVEFPRLLPVLQHPAIPSATPSAAPAPPPVTTAQTSPAQTADAPSLSSLQNSWFN